MLKNYKVNSIKNCILKLFGVLNDCYVRQCGLAFTLLVYVKLSDVSRGKLTALYMCRVH